MVGRLRLCCLSEANLSVADTLDRFEVPYIGALASSFVDEE